MAGAYNWTYEQIGQHTLVEVNELFEGWRDLPPTNILLNSIVRGFAGQGPGPSREQRAVSDAIANVSDADLAALSVKAGPALPIQRSRDLGLPKMAPVFDITEMRKRNVDKIVHTTLRNKVVGRK